MGITNFLQDTFNIDINNATKLWKNSYDYWKKINGSYIYPNGLLGKLPIYITSLQYSRSNSITGNKTFIGPELVDNISFEPYSITLNIICFGQEYYEELSKIKNLSENPEAFQNIIALYYAKTKEVYAPLAITNFDFSDNSDSTMLQKVSLKLKNVDIREFIENNGVYTTSTLNPNDYIKDVHPEDNPMPLNLLDELQNLEPYKNIEKWVKGLW